MRLTAFLLTVMCAISIAYDTAKSSTAAVTTEHTIARRLAVEGVPNLGEVSPTLYRGAQPTREGFRKLADMGIRIALKILSPYQFSGHDGRILLRRRQSVQQGGQHVVVDVVDEMADGIERLTARRAAGMNHLVLRVLEVREVVAADLLLDGSEHGVLLHGAPIGEIGRGNGRSILADCLGFSTGAKNRSTITGALEWIVWFAAFLIA